MASDRDTLAEALGHAWDDGNATGLDGYIGPGRGAGEVDPEAVRARDRNIRLLLDSNLAGWRPPAPEISTAAELDALPPLSIVLAMGQAFTAVDSFGRSWCAYGLAFPNSSAELLALNDGSVTVVYVPTEEAEPVVGATLLCGQCGATTTAPASPDGRTVPIAPLTGWQLIPDQHVVRCPGCVPTEEATGE